MPGNNLTNHSTFLGSRHYLGLDLSTASSCKSKTANSPFLAGLITLSRRFVFSYSANATKKRRRRLQSLKWLQERKRISLTFHSGRKCNNETWVETNSLRNYSGNREKGPVSKFESSSHFPGTAAGTTWQHGGKTRPASRRRPSRLGSASTRRTPTPPKARKSCWPSSLKWPSHK